MRSTTAFSNAPIRSGCRRSALGSRPLKSTRCCANGCGYCRIRSPQQTAAGYRHDISIRQAEFSLTQVLGQPVHGRLCFEQVIRENLTAVGSRRSSSFSIAAYRGGRRRGFAPGW